MMATVKRKPNLNLNPIIPLTSTTRNLAKQSDDALVDIETHHQHNYVTVGNEENRNGNRNNLQYGTLRIRRSTTDERISLNQLIYDMRERESLKSSSASSSSGCVSGSSIHDRCSPSHSSRSVGCSSICTTNESVDDVSDDDLELPLPPPPPDVMKASCSQLSLASLPPPPPEFLDSVANSPEDSSLSSARSTPRALSPGIDIAPSSRYNSFDRTLTRKHTTNGKPSARSSFFGTGPRIRGMPPHHQRPAINTQHDGDDPGSSGCESPPGTELRLPPPMPSLHALDALECITDRMNHKYKPMYSSSSSCDSSTQDCSCTTDTTVSRHSPEHYMLESLESPHATDNISPGNRDRVIAPTTPHAIVSPTVVSAAASVGKLQREQPIYDSVFTYRKNAGLIDANGQVIAQGASHALAATNCCHQNQKSSPARQPPLGKAVRTPTVISNSSENAAYHHSAHPVNNATPAVNSATYVKQSGGKQVTIAASFNDPPPDRSPCKGPLPAAPEDFVNDLIRIMDKKWSVALALSCEQPPKSSQVLGFRDPMDAMLPPTTRHSTAGGAVTTNASDAGERKRATELLPQAQVRPVMATGCCAPTAAVSDLPPPPTRASSFQERQFSAQPAYQAQMHGHAPQKPAAAAAFQQQQFSQQQFQLQHQLQHASGPLPVPPPFFRKNKKAQKPPPPPRSSETRLSQRKLL